MAFVVMFAAAGYARAQDPVSVTLSAPATVASGGSGTAKLTASIESGWYMYSITQPAGGPIQTRIALADGPFKMGVVRGPKPKVKADANFGINTETYSGTAAFTIPFTVATGTPEGPQTLNASIRYQVCNDTVCLPPKTVRSSAPITITGSTKAASSAASPTPTPSPTASPTPTPTASPTPDASLATDPSMDANANSGIGFGEFTAANTDPNLSAEAATNGRSGDSTGERKPYDSSLWSFIWLAMTFGALSLLTPCVFPMIPITVSYFTKNRAETRAGTVLDALIYAFGIILTFTGLGVLLAILFGAAGLNRFAANPYINLLIAAIFLSFAFSLLGAYNFGVPSSILTRLDQTTRGNRSGKFIGLLLMGLTFSLTSFTCTAPLVGTILVAASQGNLFYPIVGMLAFSAVFALPFFILALAPQLLHSLPRSGAWMNSVKVVMGFLEIGAALKFLSNVDLIWNWNVFTRDVVIAGWIALSVLIVLYLLGVFRFSHDPDREPVGLARILIVIFFSTLAFYLLTGLFGRRLGEIESFLPISKASIAGTAETASGELSWITNDIDAAVAQAAREQKPLFVDFTGYTCTNCRWMEANMFPRPAIAAELQNFVRVRLFTDGEGEPYESFQAMQQAKFGTVAMPLYAIVGPDQRTIAKFEGLTRSEDEFLAFLRSGKLP